MLQALEISPEKFYLHVANASDEKAMDYLPTLINNLMAIQVAPVTGSEKNFINLIRLLELNECHPHDCTAGNLTKLLVDIVTG